MLIELTEEVWETIEEAFDAAAERWVAAPNAQQAITEARKALSTPAPIGVALDVLDGAMREPVFAHLEGYQKFEGGIVMLAQIRGRGVVKPEKQPTLHDALIALSREVEGG